MMRSHIPFESAHWAREVMEIPHAIEGCRHVDTVEVKMI
jgi:hypothetical protein